MERDRFIDALRVAAVLVVVAGHWTATSVVWEPGRLVGDSALSFVPKSHYATWLLQVMPLLFFVGGFANARSLARHDGHYLAFLKTRLERLLKPTIVFVAVWLAVGLIAEALPLQQPNLLDRGADIAALPFWFVGVYVVVVALAPFMHRLHVRWGRRAVAVMAVGALCIDVIVYPVGVEAIGFVNYAFVWLLPHQLGFFYADGSLRRLQPRLLWASAAAGLGSLIILTEVFEYPVSMIMVPGEDRWNSDPPSVALVGASILLISLALLARPAFLRRQRTSRWIDRLNRVPLSMYLWHVSAISIAVAILYPLGFPQHVIGSRGWWLWRPVWLLVLAASLFVLVTLTKRFEIHPSPDTVRPEESARLISASVFGVLLVAVALLGFGVTGFNRPLANTGEGLLGLTMNPLSNVVHLLLGVAVMTTIYRGRHSTIVTAAAGLSLLVLGAVGWAEGLDLIGGNRGLAILNLVLGAIGTVSAVIPVRTTRTLPIRNEGP